MLLPGLREQRHGADERTKDLGAPSTEAAMKAYVITTGVIFALITAAHIWRGVVEKNVITQPSFVVLTAVSAALFAWSTVVLRKLP